MSIADKRGQYDERDAKDRHGPNEAAKVRRRQAIDENVVAKHAGVAGCRAHTGHPVRMTPHAKTAK